MGILQKSRLVLLVTAVMVLIFVWNEYLFATTFMLREESYTLAGGLYQLQANDYSRSWPLFSAAAILSFGADSDHFLLHTEVTWCQD